MPKTSLTVSNEGFFHQVLTPPPRGKYFASGLRTPHPTPASTSAPPTQAKVREVTWRGAPAESEHQLPEGRCRGTAQPRPGTWPSRRRRLHRGHGPAGRGSCPAQPSFHRLRPPPLGLALARLGKMRSKPQDASFHNLLPVLLPPPPSPSPPTLTWVKRTPKRGPGGEGGVPEVSQGKSSGIESPLGCRVGDLQRRSKLTCGGQEWRRRRRPPLLGASVRATPAAAGWGRLGEGGLGPARGCGGRPRFSTRTAAPGPR